MIWLGISIASVIFALLGFTLMKKVPVVAIISIILFLLCNFAYPIYVFLNEAGIWIFG